MYEEIYEQSPIQYRVKLKSHHIKSVRGQWRQLENRYRYSVYGFRCRHCQAYVYTQTMISGVQNRNHCPFCLWSRHLDYIQPGDHMSACKAIMQPIGLTMKRGRNKYNRGIFGELMLIHHCTDCGKLSINRIAADDQPEKLLELYQGSLSLDALTMNYLRTNSIHMLQAEDMILVVSQLRGNGEILKPETH